VSGSFDVDDVGEADVAAGGSCVRDRGGRLWVLAVESPCPSGGGSMVLTPEGLGPGGGGSWVLPSGRVSGWWCECWSSVGS
jgi:hypothetical protein